MSLLFMDSFAGGDYRYKWDVLSDPIVTFAPNATSRVTGNYYGQLNIGNVIFKSFPAASQVFMGVGFYSAGATAQFVVAFFGDAGATQHITVCRNTSTGRLEIRRGTTAGTLLATGSLVWANSTWHYIEVSVTISDTVGNVEVRVDGSTTPDVTFTGDTKNAGTNTTIDKISYQSSNAASFIADVYICNSSGSANNTFLGDVCVRVLTPSADGAFSQLTGSDGNQVANFQQVDEHGFSGTDYNGSSTSGQRDTYALSDLPGGVATVYGVQVSSFMAKSDATLGQAKSVLRSGGTNFYGPTTALTTTFSGYYDLYETDPATAVAWTVGGVNASETGMEVV